mgnify:CR=1 FL=1
MKKLRVDKIISGGLVPKKQTAKNFVDEAIAIRRIKDKLNNK